MPVTPDENVVREWIRQKIEELQKKPLQKIQPRSVGDPVLERSINKIRLSHLFDPELMQSNIQPMDWNNNLATSNIMGITDWGTPNQIQINPTMLALWPQYDTDETLAHELTHVRQHLGPLADVMKYEQLIPYDKRPSEIEAGKIGLEYRNRIPINELLNQQNLPSLKGKLIPSLFRKEYY